MTRQYKALLIGTIGLYGFFILAVISSGERLYDNSLAFMLFLISGGFGLLRLVGIWMLCTLHSKPNIFWTLAVLLIPLVDIIALTIIPSDKPEKINMVS